MSEITRTARLKIDLDLDVARQTIQAWTDACNYASEIAFKQSCISNPVRLQALTYEIIRSRFDLSAQVTVSVIRHVSSKYAALRTAKKLPSKPVHFINNAVMLQGGIRGRDFSFTQSGLSVWTLAGRIKSITYHGAPKLPEYLKSWKMGDARLFIRKGKVYLSISFKRDVPPIEKPNNAVIGVDRGINYIAVATDGKRSRFFSGGHTRHIRNRYTKIRANLQRKKAQKGTRSMRRALKRLSGREKRFTRNTNHVVSRRIIEFAQATGNPTIAIEKLDGIRNGRKIRKAQRTDLNRWPFFQLEGFLRYKAQALGFEVIEIDPKYTSQGCSRCGFTDAFNRNRHDFTCRACGYRSHADRNAALNIRLRGILARQALCEDGVPSITPEARTGLPVTGKPPALAGGH